MTPRVNVRLMASIGIVKLAGDVDRAGTVSMLTALERAMDDSPKRTVIVLCEPAAVGRAASVAALAHWAAGQVRGYGRTVVLCGESPLLHETRAVLDLLGHPVPAVETIADAWALLARRGLVITRRPATRPCPTPSDNSHRTPTSDPRDQETAS